ncbi:MAG: hypothetical protein ACI4I1_03225 [Oscillospiraceae bacterium]
MMTLLLFPFKLAAKLLLLITAAVVKAMFVLFGLIAILVSKVSIFIGLFALILTIYFIAKGDAGVLLVVEGVLWTAAGFLLPDILEKIGELFIAAYGALKHLSSEIELV